MIRNKDGTPVDLEILRQEHCAFREDIKDREALVCFLLRQIRESPAPRMSPEHQQLLKRITQRQEVETIISKIQR